MALSQLCCNTGNIWASVLVRALSSLWIFCTRSLATEPIHHKILFALLFFSKLLQYVQYNFVLVFRLCQDVRCISGKDWINLRLLNLRLARTFDSDHVTWDPISAPGPPTFFDVMMPRPAWYQPGSSPDSINLPSLGLPPSVPGDESVTLLHFIPGRHGKKWKPWKGVLYHTQGACCLPTS